MLSDNSARIYFLGALMARDVYGAAAVDRKLAELGAPPIGEFEER